MITIDQSLFITILIVLLAINGVVKLILGVSHTEKHKTWDLWDAGDGILALAIVFAVIVF